LLPSTFLFYCSAAHLALHSFPTRRSSDLTLGRMFFDRVGATPAREAYRYPDGDDWVSVTWGQTGDRVRRIAAGLIALGVEPEQRDRKSTRLNSSHSQISYAVFCLKKKKKN